LERQDPRDGRSQIGEGNPTATRRSSLWFAKTLADFEINDIAALPPLFCYNSYPCFALSACASERWFASCAPVGASYGELLMLGFDVSERTISRWMKRAPRDPQPATRWLTFLRNHREAIAAMDFFTIPTITFSMLYCFFVIRHDRRRILHFNVTKHPTSLWIVQQLREAFPFGSAPRFVIFDRDAKYGLHVRAAVRSLSMTPVRTSEYIRYYHEDRTHLGLGKGTPDRRTRTLASGRVLSHVRLGGLHHRYDRAA
jgi:putative transposase